MNQKLLTHPALRCLYVALFGRDLSIHSSIYLYVEQMFQVLTEEQVVVRSALIKECIYEMLFAPSYEGRAWQRRPWSEILHDLAIKQACIMWPELRDIADDVERYLFIKQQQLGAEYMQYYQDQIDKYCAKDCVY